MSPRLNEMQENLMAVERDETVNGKNEGVKSGRSPGPLAVNKMD